MSWINSRQFTISNRNGRHYVFRRNNAGNTEINIPLNITTKGQAVAWLKAHPNKVANPTRYKAKRGAAKANGLKPFERMVNGKKMIRFVNKAGKEYFRQAPRPIKKAAVPYKYVPAPAPKTPPGGWRYPSPKIHPFKRMVLSKNTWNMMTCDQVKSSLNSLKPIGKGRQGIVFTATRNGGKFAVKVAPRDLTAKKRGEPQPVDVEYNIQSAVQKLAPNVVRVYKNMRCENFITPAQMNMPNVQNSSQYDKSKQGILVMEYAPNGSLKKWFETSSPNDSAIRKVISQILETLKKIKDVYPYFSHNDLHLENIFMSARGPLIGDFGWARLKKDGTNPAVNKANGTQTSNLWGIGPKTDPRYDQHLILNEIRDWIMRHGGAAKYPETVRFLNRAVPVGYRGPKDTHVSEWRLKYGDPCTALPSLASLVGKKRLVTSPNLEAARRRLKALRTPLPPPLSPIGPKPKSKPNFRLSPSSGRAKIQSKNSGRWVYANLQTMNYLKNLAALMNVNVKGIRSKAEISKKIFGR